MDGQSNKEHRLMSAAQEFVPLIGTTDQRLLIDRVGIDPEGFLGYQPTELLGQSILGLVDAENVAAMLSAFRSAFITRQGVSTAVAVRSKDGRLLRCEAVVIPLVPGPTSAFALVVEESDAIPTSSTARQRLVERLRSGVAKDDFPTDSTASRHEGGEATGFSLLTKRELEIVHRLVSGDRVRAIADALFVSPSTVRNHLSKVYRKFGVNSQQQLVHRMLGVDNHPEASGGSTSRP
jgi:PAS domain S-box-containing protein